jgi:DNA-binding MarR family transcriptional regulator
VDLEEAVQTGAFDRLGYLLGRHGLIANSRIRDALALLGLGPRQSVVLTQLARGPMTQQAIIEQLGIDPSLVVNVLNDLEGKGLAIRRRDPSDRRRHIVEITTRGRKAEASAERSIAGVEADLFADLDPPELATLHSLLLRVKTRTDDPVCAAD